MGDAITHFMWGYQRLFRGSVEFGARAILEQLQPQLNPQAFLVGVRIDTDERLMPACVEPEVHHWAKSSDLYDVLNDVEPILRSYPESQLIHSHPVSQEREHQHLFHRALRDAVLQRLYKLESRPPDLRIFSSVPVKREGFLIMTLIAVDGSALAKVPALTTDKVWLHEFRSMDVPRSLVEAAIEVALARASAEIVQPDAGADLSVLGSADDILRRAAIAFFSGLLYRADHESFMYGPGNVFDVLTRLSLTPYEGNDPSGGIIFADKSMNAGDSVVRLSDPIPLGQLRALRKLLVLASDGLMLRCNSESAISLIREAAPQSADGTSGFTVRVIARGKWLVSLDHVELVTITDGYPSLPRPIVDEDRLAVDLRRLIPSMQASSAITFARIGSVLATSGHGSLLVIAENAVDEAIRLTNDALPVTPLELTSELAPKLSKIDGAILCAPDGVCHAVGVILDGAATSTGDRGRGARFNSAMRYVNANATRCAALVVSEDGGVDLLPRLKPLLPKGVLLAKLDELKGLEAVSKL